MSWLREPDAEPLPGYRLIKPLGTGGFGEVWQCEAPGGILKAIKFVYGNLNAVDGDNLRAEQEFRAMQKMREVRHPFVLTIERIDIVEGELAIVMELADKSLHDELMEEQKEGRIGISFARLLGYISDAAEGLDYLVDHYNLSHLDVKPRNLFVIGGRVKVADFGLVKNLERQSSTGLMGGMSPMYAAPETFSGEISRHSDQYSLAIVFTELLTGQRPFRGRNIRQLALQHMSEEPDLRSLPDECRPMIAKALHKNPLKRYPNCTAFVQALAGTNLHRTRYSFPSIEGIDLPANSSGAEKSPVSKSSIKIPPPPRSLQPSQQELEELSQIRKEKESIFELPPAEASIHLSQTISQPELHFLRPTIILGVGGFGREVLRDLRHRLIDAFGDLTQIPIIRFLYLDPDTEAAEAAIRSNPERALSLDQVFSMPLQPLTDYRRRILDHIQEWLPREKLFAIPRSHYPQGVRAISRLSFSDNYLRLTTRLKRELQIATHPESLSQSISALGFPLRDNVPRIYVIASTGGGSSGMLIDLGYTLRRLVTQINSRDATIDSFLFCGAPQDPVTSKSELANTYATLTEFNHFNDPNISFNGQYGGPDGPKIVSSGMPYSSVYLLQQENRTPDNLTDCISHLSTYLTREVTTPLGLSLEKSRLQPCDPDRTPFRSLGTYSIWFPRGLMLRASAREMCLKLLQEWQLSRLYQPSEAVEKICDESLKHPSLLSKTILEELKENLYQDYPLLMDEIRRQLSRWENELPQVGSRIELSSWSNQIYEQIREWFGRQEEGDLASGVKGNRIASSLGTIVQNIIKPRLNLLVQDALRLMEMPGPRLANAELAMTRMIETITQLGNQVARDANESSLQSQRLRADLQAAYEMCLVKTGFSLFGNRNPRLARHFVERCQQYVQARLSEDFQNSLTQTYRKIQGKLEEQLRDLSFCRQRLSHLDQMLQSPADPFALNAGARDVASTSKKPAGQTSKSTQLQSYSRMIEIRLPYGESSIENATRRFIQSLLPENTKKLEEVLQAIVLSPLGGLFAICRKNYDLLRQLAGPLIEQTAAYLSDLLSVTDVVQAELSKPGVEAIDLTNRLISSLEYAKPLVGGNLPDQKNYVIIPESEAGNRLAQSILDKKLDWQVIRTPGNSTDLTLCREQGYLRFGDLHEMLQHCRQAYDSMCQTPIGSPHNRFDISEWIPLDV